MLWRRFHSTTGVHEVDALGRDLFGLPLDTHLASTGQQLMAAGVDVPDDIDNVQITLLELTLDVAAGIPHLQEKLEDKEITGNVTNRSALFAGSRACRGGTRFARWSLLMCGKNKGGGNCWSKIRVQYVCLAPCCQHCAQKNSQTSYLSSCFLIYPRTKQQSRLRLVQPSIIPLTTREGYVPGYQR